MTLKAIIGKIVLILLIIAMWATGCSRSYSSYTPDSGCSGISETKKANDHLWAGDYYKGDGLGMNIYLSLSEKGKFEYQWYGCLGLYDSNFGNVTYEDGKLDFDCQEYRLKSLNFIDTGVKFVLVKWDQRSYLIPETKMTDFCNAINDGTEPRDRVHGYFLLRKDDYKKTVKGAPDLPDKYLKMLLNEPIEATVISIETPQIKEFGKKLMRIQTPVTLDVGTNQGVFIGLQFHTVGRRFMFGKADVVEVKAETCRAFFTDISENISPPPVGLKFSTQPKR